MVGPILDERELKVLGANEVLSHGTGCLSGMGGKRRDREVRAILRLSSRRTERMDSDRDPLRMKGEDAGEHRGSTWP